MAGDFIIKADLTTEAAGQQYPGPRFLICPLQAQIAVTDVGGLN